MGTSRCRCRVIPGNCAGEGWSLGLMLLMSVRFCEKRILRHKTCPTSSKGFLKTFLCQGLRQGNLNFWSEWISGTSESGSIAQFKSTGEVYFG